MTRVAVRDGVSHWCQDRMETRKMRALVDVAVEDGGNLADFGDEFGEF
jgi:hypothetical protein